MNRDYSRLTNEELVHELKNSIKETNLIFKEIGVREKDRRLKREYDEVDKYLFKKHSSKKARSA